jgi:hypothetical protein
MIDRKNLIISYVDARPRGVFTCRAIHEPTGKIAYKNGRDKEALITECCVALYDKISACYIREPVLRVKHKELRRFSAMSEYKSTCPKCLDGILMMQRDINTYELLSKDRCILCGQEFEYTDLNNGELR